MKRKSYIFIVGLFCLLCNCCIAQLDVIHYLPPFIGEGSWMKMDSTFLYITTPSKNPVTFTIKTGTTLLYSGTVSLYAPVRWLIGTGDNTVISLPNDSLNKALNNHGLIIQASNGIYVNERTIRTPQAASLCTKGKNALGTNFRIGHMWNDSTKTSEDNGIGIMATEDNTIVTLKVLGRKLGFGYAPGSLTLPTPIIIPGKNITFTLNKYQTYVLDASSAVVNAKGKKYLSSNNGLIGTNLISNKPIAVVTGSFTGGGWTGQDDGFDEIEDEKHIGSQFIFMEGAGVTEATNNEVAVIVADQNNTSIYVNGAATPIATINAGGYYVIQGTNYVNNSMYVKTSQSVYAYQTYMGSDGCCTYDMTFIPPLYQCVIEDTVVISDVSHIGSTGFTGAIRIVAKMGVPVYVNGVAATGPIPVIGNPNYVLYVIPNATGEYVINCAEPIQAGYYGLNSNLGYGSLFSGFNVCLQSYTICKGDSVLLKANATFPTNTWLFNNNTIAKDTLSHYAKDSGKYIITYGPYLYDTISVRFYPSYPIHITYKTSSCKEDSLLLKATAGFTNYKWSNKKTKVDSIYAKKSGWYWVTATDPKGCIVKDSIHIVFNPPISVNITGEASVCQNIPVTLCANTTGGIGAPYTYSWTGYSSTPCISVTPSITTTYSVSVVDNCGASSTASGTVQINPSPNVNFNSDIYSGCMPLCVQFYNYSTVQGNNAESYNWTFGNGAALSSQSATYCYSDSGTYTVGLTVISDSGCSSTLERKEMIHVFGHPNAAFTVSPQPTDILSSTIHFQNQTADPNRGITYWTWTYGDALDSIGTGQNTIHTYHDTGSYCAKLVVMDQKGCTDTATNCLIIDPIFTLYIPNAFTPNGDGMDDIFTAKGEYAKDFQMYIFNRWGEQLYYTTDINKGWNGTMKGETTFSQEDTYVYKIIATDWKNNQHSYIGSITLLK